MTDTLPRPERYSPVIHQPRALVVQYSTVTPGRWAFFQKQGKKFWRGDRGGTESLITDCTPSGKTSRIRPPTLVPPTVRSCLNHSAFFAALTFLRLPTVEHTPELKNKSSAPFLGDATRVTGDAGCQR